MTLDRCCWRAFSFVYRIFNHLLNIVLNFYNTFLAVYVFFSRLKLFDENEGISIYWMRDLTIAFLMGALILN